MRIRRSRPRSFGLRSGERSQCREVQRGVGGVSAAPNRYLLSSTALTAASTTATNMLPANSAFVNLRRLLAKGPAAGGTLTRTISACPPDHSSFAAPLLNKPAPTREIGGCPPEYSRMAARVHKCNTKLPHVSASYSDEELMANIWTRAIARNGRPSRHRCAAPVAHSPLTHSAHPRTAHPLTRSRGAGCTATSARSVA